MKHFLSDLYAVINGVKYELIDTYVNGTDFKQFILKNEGLKSEYFNPFYNFIAPDFDIKACLERMFKHFGVFDNSIATNGEKFINKFKSQRTDRNVTREVFDVHKFVVNKFIGLDEYVDSLRIFFNEMDIYYFREWEKYSSKYTSFLIR